MAKNEIPLTVGFRKRRTLRFTEYLIRPGDELYVMGTAESNPEKGTRKENKVNNLSIHKGKNDKTFYISDKPEKKILEKLRYNVLTEVYGGAALSIVCLAIILFYFGMI